MEKLTGWRKIASAMWSAPDDPQIYGSLEFDATPLEAYIERARSAGHHVTLTHMAGRAMATALAAVPDFNVRIYRGKVYPRDGVDVFFITAVEGGRSLSGVKVERSDAKSAIEISIELAERAGAMKRGDDPDFAKTKHTMEKLAPRLLRQSLRFAAWVAGDRNKNIRSLGVKASPFGSAMLTSVGMFGIPQGFAPLAKFYRVPLLILVGEVDEKPVVVDGAVVVRPILPVTATIDHRYADGWHISNLIKPFRAYMADPTAFEPDPATVPAPALVAATEPSPDGEVKAGARPKARAGKKAAGP